MCGPRAALRHERAQAYGAAEAALESVDGRTSGSALLVEGWRRLDTDTLGAIGVLLTLLRIVCERPSTARDVGPVRDP